MTGTRHFTASGIVLNHRHDQVLLVHHHKLGRWLYPGGHIDPNEDPAQAAQREVLEETGIHTHVITDPPFHHPAVTTHPNPFAIIEMDVTDPVTGPHRHIDMLYVLHAATKAPTAQIREVAEARWVTLTDITGFDMPPELPALVTAAACWARTRP